MISSIMCIVQFRDADRINKDGIKRAVYVKLVVFDMKCY